MKVSLTGRGMISKCRKGTDFEFKCHLKASTKASVPYVLKLSFLQERSRLNSIRKIFTGLYSRDAKINDRVNTPDCLNLIDCKKKKKRQVANKLHHKPGDGLNTVEIQREVLQI